MHTTTTSDPAPQKQTAGRRTGTLLVGLAALTNYANNGNAGHWATNGTATSVRYIHAP